MSNKQLMTVAVLVALAWAVYSVTTSPGVTTAARQSEQARAESLWAEAALKWQGAKQAELDTQARAAALESQALGLRFFWLSLYGGAGVAVVVVLIGGALAVVKFTHTRAALVYANSAGVSPVIIERGWRGELVLVDTSPARLASVVQVSRGGAVSMARSGSEQAALSAALGELQARALVSSVQAQAHQGGGASSIGGQVVRAAQSAARSVGESATMPVFAQQRVTGAPSLEGPRFVYVKGVGAANTAVNRELADLREFIELGAVRGFTRRSWCGFKFKSGHECTQTRHGELVDKLRRAGVVVQHGKTFELAVSVAEALDAFGVGERDEHPAEDESAGGEA